MELFISWSGDHSRQIAVALADWIPKVLQSVHPWVSDKDIHSGQRWQTEIVAQLEKCTFGIVVVTAENQLNPWLQFEAGALSKAVDRSLVVPLLVDLAKPDLRLPLNMFQAELLDQAGVKNVMESIKSIAAPTLSEAAFAESIDLWWPRLDTQLDGVQPAPAAIQPPTRPDRELLEELLTLVRGLRNSAPEEPSDAQALLKILRVSGAGGRRVPGTRPPQPDLKLMERIRDDVTAFDADLVPHFSFEGNVLTVAVLRDELPPWYAASWDGMAADAGHVVRVVLGSEARSVVQNRK